MLLKKISKQYNMEDKLQALREGDTRLWNHWDKTGCLQSLH